MWLDVMLKTGYDYMRDEVVVVKEASLIFSYEEDNLISQEFVKALFQDLNIAQLAELFPDVVESWGVSIRADKCL